jgi:hypothetical protein
LIPYEFGVAGQSHKWVSGMGESFNKSSVKIAEA